MHKLISCDYTASAEIDGDKFGITMLGTMSLFVLHFIFLKALSISSPGVREDLAFIHSLMHSFLKVHFESITLNSSHL